MKWKVATMAIRLSHRLFDRARRSSNPFAFAATCAPTTYSAEQSTKSQLLIQRVLARYERWMLRRRLSSAFL